MYRNKTICFLFNFVFCTFREFNNFLFFFLLFKKLIYFNWRLITILWWFCHTLTWISHGCTCVPHPDLPSHFTLHPIPQGHPVQWLWVLCFIHWTWTGDLFHIWKYIVSMLFSRIIPPLTSPTEFKVCSLNLCLFCYLSYRSIVTIFLNSIYMC